MIISDNLETNYSRSNFCFCQQNISKMAIKKAVLFLTFVMSLVALQGIGRQREFVYSSSTESETNLPAYNN